MELDDFVGESLHKSWPQLEEFGQVRVVYDARKLVPEKGIVYVRSTGGHLITEIVTETEDT